MKFFKRLLSLAIVGLLAIALGHVVTGGLIEKEVCAAGNDIYEIVSGSCGENLTYVLTSDGTMTISGSGDMTYQYNPWDSYNLYIEKVVITEGVTSIKDAAFRYCEDLKSITIPKSVICIGESAFSGCTELTSITIPESVTCIGESAFYGCKGLTSIVISEGVTEIGESAFYGCKGLTSITIPESVIEIGSQAFSICDRLTSITIPINTKYQNDVFWDCDNIKKIVYTGNGTLTSEVVSLFSFANEYSVIIQEGITEICDSAFENCKNIISLTIPQSMQKIGDNAFGYCSNLSTVTIPNSLKKSIDYSNAFYATPWKMNNIPDEGSIGSCTWSLNNGVFTISGSENIEGGIIPEEYRKISGYSVIIKNGINTIDVKAFYGCIGLTNITIPGSVTKIYYEAFRGCVGLTNINIPESVTYIGDSAFADCKKLKNLVLPDSLKKSIDCSNVFYATPWKMNNIPDEGTNGSYSWSLKNGVFTIKLSGELEENIIPEEYCDIQGYSVVFKDVITKIGDYAFYRCEGLTSITIPKGVTQIGDYAFYGCERLTSITIPEGVTQIGDYAFYGCERLTSITIPEGVTKIGDYAFAGCNGLTSITIPEGITEIGMCSFAECKGLTSITIPEGVTEIGTCSFDECKGLTSITIPNSVSNIDSSAFSDCDGIKSIVFTGSGILTSESVPKIEIEDYSVTIKDGITQIGDYVFGRNSGLTSIVIPEGVTQIGECAFAGCKGLTSIVIPESVTQIGEYAFDNCMGLTSIVIPEGVTKIGDHAFSGCKRLTNLTIPESVIEIDNGAFSGCTRLTSVFCPCKFKGLFSKNVKINLSHGKIVVDKAVKATCISKGKTKGKHCLVCKTVILPQKIIPKLKPTIKLSATNKTIKTKQSFTLTVSKLSKGDLIKSVKSSNKIVATVKVDKKNKTRYIISAKKKGKTTITVILKSGKKAYCRITVR